MRLLYGFCQGFYNFVLFIWGYEINSLMVAFHSTFPNFVCQIVWNRTPSIFSGDTWHACRPCKQQTKQRVIIFHLELRIPINYNFSKSFSSIFHQFSVLVPAFLKISLHFESWYRQNRFFEKLALHIISTNEPFVVHPSLALPL